MASKQVYEDVAKAIRIAKKRQIAEGWLTDSIFDGIENVLIQHFKADNKQFSPKLFKEACHVEL
tara:strand:+ start:423 stop:614 length:192 start_codon:yes stop_codon:yes gene_type:complete